MPRLHVIYDKNSVLEHGGHLPADKFKIAVMDISDDLHNEEIKDCLKQLGTLLLEQVRRDAE